MSKLLKVLSSIALTILFVFVIVANAYAETEKVGVILANDVNVREASNTSSKILTQVSKDTVVKVYRESDQWYEISIENYKGWVFGEYLFVSGEAASTGTVTASVVNFRKEPNLDSQVIKKIYKGEVLTIHEKSGEWYRASDDKDTGWVFAEYVTVSQRPAAFGTITGDGVNMRSSADINSNVITKLDKGTQADIYERSGDWYKIVLSDKRTGWVIKDYISISKSSTVSRGGSENTTSSAGTSKKENDGAVTAEKLIAFAKKLLGVRYKWGGESPSGFDCSGFVKYVYGNFGIHLVHNSAQMANSGTKVSRDALKPGDVLFFNTDGEKGIDHVGIYLGNQSFIHASSSQKKIVIGDLSGYYSKYYVTARRYL